MLLLVGSCSRKSSMIFKLAKKSKQHHSSNQRISLFPSIRWNRIMCHLLGTATRCVFLECTQKTPITSRIISLAEKQLQIDHKAVINEIHINLNGKNSRCISVSLLNRLHIVVQDKVGAASCYYLRFRQRLFSSFNQMQKSPRISLKAWPEKSQKPKWKECLQRDLSP